MKDCNLQTKERRMCPALILAKRRKQRVRGRTEILTISTSLKKEAKYHGEFKGNREDAESFLRQNITILTNQKNSALPKFNLKVVVTGYL